MKKFVTVLKVVKLVSIRTVATVAKVLTAVSKYEKIKEVNYEKSMVFHLKCEVSFSSEQIYLKSA